MCYDPFQISYPPFFTICILFATSFILLFGMLQNHPHCQYKIDWYKVERKGACPSSGRERTASNSLPLLVASNVCLGTIEDFQKLCDAMAHARVHVCLGALDVVV